MDTQLTIDEFAFQDIYRPILDTDGSWRDFWWRDDPECLARLAEAAPERRVWTLVDIGGFTLVTSGRHFVNRLAYYITEVPVPDDVDVDVYDRDEFEEWEASLRADDGVSSS